MPLRVTGEPIPLLSAAAPGFSLLESTGPVILSIPFVEQVGDNWCWAAVCEMILRYYGNSGVSQYDIASTQFGANCSLNPHSFACDNAAFPDETFDRWGISYDKTYSPVDFDTIRAQLNEGRPVIVYYKLSEIMGHLAIVVGWYNDGDVRVHDPRHGYGRILFSDLFSANGEGSWKLTYTDLPSV